MRRFHLVRNEDLTGVSGVGMVAEGVQFENGKCAMNWRGSLSSTAVYDTIEHVVAIHGHGGRTRVSWLDV